MEMTGSELRDCRRLLGLTQSEFADKLGISRDFVGSMERGSAPIAPRTAMAARLLSTPVARRTITTDPMEKIIEGALCDAGIAFRTDYGGGNTRNLDFYLPDIDVYIEVKRMHSPRVAEQMARAENVIVAQGVGAVRALAAAIRGDMLDRVAEPSETLATELAKRGGPKNMVSEYLAANPARSNPKTLSEHIAGAAAAASRGDNPGRSAPNMLTEKLLAAASGTSSAIDPESVSSKLSKVGRSGGRQKP